MIYLGVSVTVGEVTTNSVVRFKEGATTLLGTFTSPCATNGLAISGGVLLVSCEGTPNPPSTGSTRTPGSVWESTAP